MAAAWLFIRLMGVDVTFEWIKQCDIVVTSIEYRLGPEHSYPVLLEDCYAGLKGVSENESELGIDAD
jgi:acetyl esterase/lipase